MNTPSGRTATRATASVWPNGFVHVESASDPGLSFRHWCEIFIRINRGSSITTLGLKCTVHNIEFTKPRCGSYSIEICTSGENIRPILCARVASYEGADPNTLAFRSVEVFEEKAARHRFDLIMLTHVFVYVSVLIDRNPKLSAPRHGEQGWFYEIRRDDLAIALYAGICLTDLMDDFKKIFY